MRAIHFGNTAKILTVVLGALCAAPMAQAQPAGGAYKVIKLDNRTVGAVSSEGLLAGKTLYMAAQDGRSADGSLPASFAQEVRQSLDHTREVLKAAGMDMGNLAWVQVYVTREEDIAAMNAVYWKSIGANPPARTVLVVAALPGGQKIQINAIAMDSTAKRSVITPAGWPHGKGRDPAGIQVDDMLYISAQSGANPRTGKLPEDYGAEVQQSLDNVGAVLKAAGMGIPNVVWTNPYMASPDGVTDTRGTPTIIAHNGQAQAPRTVVMNKIYAATFEFGNTPGRGTIEVAQLPGDARIVFDAIAGADLSQRHSIRPKNMPLSPTASPGILYRDTYYMSGKSGFIPDQGIVTQDVELQLRQTMRNLLDDLQEADMDFPDVTQAIVYVRDIADIEKVQNLYGTFFKTGIFPTRTSLQNSFDKKTATGEQISFIAVRQPKAQK
ncbi:MAG: RidA family protein [Alphaproteobacteria bacterium]|nr:RidA family protein [Alphaproteobacteria bacterium]